jgi:hypothetical protein
MVGLTERLGRTKPERHEGAYGKNYQTLLLKEESCHKPTIKSQG